MEDWVRRALEKWPNVPHLYGWLSLDRRGRWRVRDALITRPQIIETINRNYACDHRGCWYFQNGPQRGYVALAYAPLILHVGDEVGERLRTHNGLSVQAINALYLDQEGALLAATEHGAALFADQDLVTVCARITNAAGQSVSDEDLIKALDLASGAQTALSWQWRDQRVCIRRLDQSQAPEKLGFVRVPQPPGEKDS
ncbi:MAG: DUF2946 family protein [Panacagrimonas sp.]